MHFAVGCRVFRGDVLAVEHQGWHLEEPWGYIYDDTKVMNRGFMIPSQWNGVYYADAIKNITLAIESLHGGHAGTPIKIHWFRPEKNLDKFPIHDNKRVYIPSIFAEQVPLP